MNDWGYHEPNNNINDEAPVIEPIKEHYSCSSKN